MYKALITDLDGTAVMISSDGSDVDGKTRHAVMQAQQRGFKLACATGREWKLAKPVIDSLGFVSPCIIEGGTRIVEPATGKTLWEKYLDPDVPEAILDIFKREAKTGVLMFSTDSSRQPLHSVNSAPEKLRFIYLLAVEEQVAVKIINTVNVLRSTIAHMTPSWDGGDLVDIHVTHAEGTKEHAIQIWQEMENISKKETIGLGDSGNDLPIFQSAGLKVAVENARPELKRLADYIAPSVHEDGLVHVINKFLM
jgi:Cof subfamily protein (haloacid dehalogenase superfamily)